jgi:hypothetical protein
MPYVINIVKMSLRSEQFQSSRENTDKLNPLVMQYVMNTMNNAIEK